MYSTTLQSTSTHELAKLAILVIATTLITCSQGLNAILFPISMENYGFNKTLIGLITAIEVLAGIIISLKLPKLIHSCGLLQCFAVSTLMRALSITLLSQTHNEWSWLIAIFAHGLGAFTFLMLLQILISSIPFKKNRALKIALFGTSISVGYALGPIVFDQLSKQLTGHELYLMGFYVSASISFIAFVPLLLWGSQKTIDNGANHQPKVWRLLKEAPDIMGAVIIVGIAIFGLSQFITLYGKQQGWPIEQAALLVSAYMLGALFLELPLSYISDHIGRFKMLVLTSSSSLLLCLVMPLVFSNLWLTYLVFFLLGGLIGALYSVALTSLSERYHGNKLLEANSGFALLDNVGGVIGLLLLGIAMDNTLHHLEHGLPLVLASSLGLYLICLALVSYTKSKHS